MSVWFVGGFFTLTFAGILAQWRLNALKTRPVPLRTLPHQRAARGGPRHG